MCNEILLIILLMCNINNNILIWLICNSNNININNINNNIIY